MRPNRRIDLFRVNVAAAVLVAALSARADETRVVENRDHGLWDNEPRRTFQLLEDMLLGSLDGDDAFGRVTSVAVDSRGRWIILDTGYEVVRVYDPDAMTMESIGQTGEGPGEFNQPMALGVDSDDRIYVASQGGRVAVFSPQGGLVDEFRHKFPGGGPVVKVEVGANGIYLASLDPVDHKIVHRYDARYRYLASFSDSRAAVKPMEFSEEFATCGGSIDLGPDGAVYFAQWSPYEIRKFTPDGRLVLTIHRANDFLVLPHIERTNDSFSIRWNAGSAGVIVLPDGRLMHVTTCFPGDDDSRAYTVVDLFDANGRLLKSRRFAGRIAMQCVDDSWRAYSIEARDYPIVVRYEIRLP